MTNGYIGSEGKNIQEKAAWSSKEHRDEEIRRARSILGIPISGRTESLQEKGAEGGAAGSLVGYLSGTGREGRFSQDELKKVFFSADLTLAEIESGTNSFENIERELLNRMVSFELAKVNTTETT